jgi:hypothetical protein
MFQEARMCFDSLTITGLVIFFSVLALVVRFCILAPCGGSNIPELRDNPGSE